MKITAVEPVLLSAALGEDDIVRWSGGEMAVANAALVAIHTDQGVVGVGDTYAGGWFYPKSAAAMISHFAPLLIGRSPLDPTLLANDLRAKCLYWGRVGASINAISAIENALWDIAGQAAGLPVWKMVGGLAHERLKIYASAGLEKTPALVVKEMEKHLKDGFKAVKIRVSTDLTRAVEKVRLCRETLGPEVDLMVDAVMGSHPAPWDAKTALRFAERIEQYDIAWLEEPCAGDDYDGYASVRAGASMPISGGETSFGLGEFMHFLRSDSLDIIQPDACTSGGIVECQRICAAAAGFGRRVAPHAWGSSATVTANLAWAFTQPNVCIQEYPAWGFPLRDALLAEPLDIREGYIYPPSTPGLGLQLTDEIRSRYAWREDSGARMRVD